MSDQDVAALSDHRFLADTAAPIHQRLRHDHPQGGVAEVAAGWQDELVIPEAVRVGQHRALRYALPSRHVLRARVLRLSD